MEVDTTKRGVLAFGPKPRPHALAIAVALVCSLAVPAVVFGVNAAYGGYKTGGSGYDGIKGYISHGTGPDNGALIATWINICPTSSCVEWVQTGTAQGQWAWGGERDKVHVYAEFVEPCTNPATGHRWYHAQDFGVAASSTMFFSIKYDGLGYDIQTCSDGSQFHVYNFDYLKGSSQTPFFGGFMSDSDGIAIARVEVQAVIDYGTYFFGCSQSSCDNSAFGLRLHTPATGWNLWTAPSIGDIQPPCRFAYHNYWAFKVYEPNPSC